MKRSGMPLRLLAIASALAVLGLPVALARAQTGTEASYESEPVSQPQVSWSSSSLSDHLARRKACNRQATERGLSWRMARRYTRLCLSGRAVPKPTGQ